MDSHFGAHRRVVPPICHLKSSQNGRVKEIREQTNLESLNIVYDILLDNLPDSSFTPTAYYCQEKRCIDRRVLCLCRYVYLIIGYQRNPKAALQVKGNDQGNCCT